MTSKALCPSAEGLTVEGWSPRSCLKEFGRDMVLKMWSWEGRSLWIFWPLCSTSTCEHRKTLQISNAMEWAWIKSEWNRRLGMNKEGSGTWIVTESHHVTTFFFSFQTNQRFFHLPTNAIKKESECQQQDTRPLEIVSRIDCWKEWLYFFLAASYIISSFLSLLFTPLPELAGFTLFSSPSPNSKEWVASNCSSAMLESESIVLLNTRKIGTMSQ